MTMPKRLETEARELTARIDQPMELNVQEVVGQAQKVLEIMRQTMRAGIHYGAVVPGTDRRSLLKPGAERLCLTFRLAPSFNIRRQDLDGGHREYEIVCTLRHQPTDMILGEGVGCASTMESKYRWRWENTGRLVPADYWKAARDSAILGGPDFVARKIEGKWWIFHRIEHDNPADYHNTCLKIAKKRALVDVVLCATAASDVFSHEVEEEEKEEKAEQREPGQEG